MTGAGLRYRAGFAQSQVDQKARRPKASKLAEHDLLRAQVQTWLGKHWSSEQITCRLVVDFPDDEGMRVSHETIARCARRRVCPPGCRRPNGESVRNRGRLTGRLLCRTSLVLEGTRNAPQKLLPQAPREPPPYPRHQFERVEYLRSSCLPHFLTLSHRSASLAD